MPNCRIVPRNFHDEATLSTSVTAAAEFPVDNTQNVIRDEVWRSTTTGDQNIDGTYADDVSRTANAFFVFRHRCHGANIRLRLYSDTAWASQVYDSSANPVVNVDPSGGYDWGIDPYSAGGNDPFAADAPYWLYFTAAAHKSYRITLSGFSAGFGADVWQVSRFFLGKYFEVGRNPAFGQTLGFADLSDRNRSRGGSLRTNTGESWRALAMDFHAMGEADAPTWLDIMRYCGTGRDFAFSLWPGEDSRRERDHVMNAKFVSLDALGRQTRVLTKRFQIEET